MQLDCSIDISCNALYRTTYRSRAHATILGILRKLRRGGEGLVWTGDTWTCTCLRFFWVRCGFSTAFFVRAFDFKDVGIMFYISDSHAITNVAIGHHTCTRTSRQETLQSGHNLFETWKQPKHKHVYTSVNNRGGNGFPRGWSGRCRID